MAKERIGVMGGSFNPIHRRHMDIAQCALQEGQLSRILFIPTGNPPHKHEGLAPAEHRYEMVHLSVICHTAFSASRIEIDRGGLIYSVDTLKLLQKQHPTAEFFYIIGEDTLLDLPNWRSPDEVFALCRFLVCKRSISQDTSTQPLQKSLELRGARFQFLSLPPVDISATAIRHALLLEKEPDNLYPQVLEYIRLMGLYGVPASPADAARLYPRLRNSLTDKRLLHSLLVAFTARQLARTHGLDESTAALAGLLHDCAKCFPLSTLQRIAAQHRLLLDKETLANQNLLHGPVGATIAQKDYGITDPNILSAIRCHTTGKVGMLPMDMVLYLADKIEPSRKVYPALEKVRSLSQHSLVEAMYYSLRSTLTYVTRQQTEPHPATKQTAEWLNRLISQQHQRSKSNE